MKAEWNFSSKDLKGWKKLYEDNKLKTLVVKRHDRNVKRNGIDVGKMNIWRALVGCQLTTQQRSGPNSKVSQFLKSENLILDLRELRRCANVKQTIENEISNNGLRRGKNIADYLSRILIMLEKGEWRELIAKLNTLVKRPTQKRERGVIAYLLSEHTAQNGQETSKKYPGLGQKQSRNFIQWLGLSRHEIPLDSRVLKRLKELGANFVPSGSALSDETVYQFVQSGIQRIAKSLKLYPCLLDACLFASFDIDDEFTPDDEEV